MNKSYISFKFIATMNTCRTHNLHEQVKLAKENTMNTIFSTVTRNFDIIQIILTQDNWYEIYFNGKFISQTISLSMAYDEVESQLSL